MILSFDPGKKGGYCLLNRDRAIMAIGNIPLVGKTWDGDRLRPLFQQAELVIIERVNAGATPGRGSAFSFGEGFGFLQGMASGLTKRLETVPARTWQAEMLSGAQGADTKARALVAALRGWPEDAEMIRGMRDGPIDALLIAEWGRRNRR